MTKRKKRLLIFISVFLCFVIGAFSAYEGLSAGGEKPFFYFNSYTVKSAEVCGPYGSNGAQLTKTETEELCDILREMRKGPKVDILTSLQNISDGGNDQEYRITLFDGRVISIGSRNSNYITIDFVDYENSEKCAEVYDKLSAHHQAARIAHEAEIEENGKDKGATS